MALGIPDRRNIGNMSTLPTDVVLTLIRQRHNARRSGLHEDTRLGSPAGLFSFATPKFLPDKPGEKRLMIPQPIHDWSYKDFEGTIPEGYGAGEVSRIEESPVVLLLNEPDHIIFTRGNSKDSPIYNMIKTRNGNWLCSIKQEGQPTAVLTYKKEHFQRRPIEQIADIIDNGARVTAKIDGASSLVYLGDKGIRVFGTRVGANGKRPEYSDYIGGLRGFEVPEELRGKLLRGELYGVRAGGRPIHPNELSAILHSNLVTAIDKKQKGGINLLIAALAENKNGVDDYYSGAVDIANKLNHPAIHGLPSVTGEAAKRLVEKIRTGKLKLTREGVVLAPKEGRPIKAKRRDDYDAVVRGVFPAETKGEPRAGGFYYSLPGSDKIVGRVGSGFDHAMLKDMLAHPENYIGKEMRLASQEQYPNTKSLRAPSFIAMRAD